MLGHLYIIYSVYIKLYRLCTYFKGILYMNVLFYIFLITYTAHHIHIYIYLPIETLAARARLSVGSRGRAQDERVQRLAVLGHQVS